MRTFCKNLFVAILFLNQIAMADDGYQLETTLTHDRYEFDLGYESDDNKLGATYYFSKVDPGNYPFKEAAFMSRSSTIGIDYKEGFIESNLGSKAYPVSFGLDAYYASPNHPYVIGGSVSEIQLDSGSGFTGSESKSYSVSPGYFLRKNLLLGAFFSKLETEYIGGGTYDYDFTALRAKWLHFLPSGKTYNFVAGVGRSNFDSSFGSGHSTVVFLSGDYYVTRSFSVGASVSVSDSSDSESNATSYGLSTSWFITPRLFTQLSGRRYNQDRGDLDNISLSLGVRL